MGRNPDECHGDALVFQQQAAEQLALMAIGFTQLALDAVAVNGMFEKTLRHADEHLYGDVASRAFIYIIYGPDRKSSHRVTACPAE